MRRSDAGGCGRANRRPTRRVAETAQSIGFAARRKNAALVEANPQRQLKLRALPPRASPIGAAAIFGRRPGARDRRCPRRAGRFDRPAAPIKPA